MFDYIIILIILIILFWYFNIRGKKKCVILYTNKSSAELITTHLN